MAAGGAVIGALRVVLSADTAAFETGLKKASLSLGGFSSGIKTAGVVIAGALVAGAATLALGLGKAVNQMDELGKSSQKLGIPVEDLSALKHAADLSGVSMESLSKATVKLSRSMVEAASKPTGEAAVAFRALGVEVKNADGSLKSTMTVMTSVAEAFSRLENDAAKTTLVTKLFGKSAQDLIPLLNSGKTGLAAMILEARALGLVIDTNTAKAAEGFNDNLKRLVSIMGGAWIQATAKMLPVMLSLSQRLLDAAKNGNLVERIANAIAKAFEGMVRAITLVVDNFSLIARVLAVFVALTVAAHVVRMALAFVKFASAVRLAGLAMAAFNIVQSFSRTGLLLIAGLIAIATFQFEALEEKLTKLAGMAKKLFPEDLGKTTIDLLTKLGLKTDALTKELTAMGVAAGGPAAGGLGKIDPAALAAAGSMNQYIDSIQKLIVAKNAEAATLGLTGGQIERHRLVMEGLNGATVKSGPIFEAFKQKLLETGMNAQFAIDRLAGLQRIQEALPLMEQYRMEVEKARFELEAAGATAEQVGKVNEKIAKKYGTDWQSASASIAGSMAEMADTFGSELSAMASAAKILHAVQALISTYAGAAEALALPFPANLAASATVLAKGLALVAAIRSAVVPKMQTGGSFTIPGGLGGADSKMVPIMGFPGERVSVERPDGRGAGGGSRRLVVEGLDPERFFTGDVLRALIRNLIDAQRDKHEVVLS